MAPVEQVLARVLDAGRLGPGERMAADEAPVPASASATSRLVEPTSLTTQSGPAAPSARATVSASAPTGAATNTTSAPATAPGDVRRRRVDRARARAPLAQRRGSGS